MKKNYNIFYLVGIVNGYKKGQITLDKAHYLTYKETVDGRTTWKTFQEDEEKQRRGARYFEALAD